MNEPTGLDEFLGSGGAAPAGGSPAPAPTAAGSPPSGLDEFIAPEMNDAKYGGAGSQIAAGLEGVARGATLGASDLAETKLFGVPAADIKGRMQANPATSFLGSVGGGAGLIAATGGLGAPAEAALGAGLGADLAAGGAEGALFGAGNAVSDAALGDPNLNAQKILTDVGMGAVLGVGAGAIGSGLKSIAGKFGRARGSVAEAVAKESDAANQSARTAEVIASESGLKKSAGDIMDSAQRLDLPVMSGMVSDNPWVQKAEDALINGAPTYSGIKRAQLYADAYNGAVGALDEVVPESTSGLTKAQVGSALQDSLTSQIAEENKPISQLYEAIKERTQHIPLSERSAPAIARNILDLDEVKLSPSSPEAKVATRVADEISNLKTVDDVKAYRAILNRSISPTASPGEKRIAAILSDKLVNLEENSIERYAGKLKAGLADADPEKQEIFRPLVEQIDSLLEQKKIANAQYKPFIEKIGALAEQLGKKRTYGPQDAINFIQDLTPEQISDRLFAKKNSQFMKFFGEEFPEQMALMREYQKNALREASMQNGAFNPKVFFKKLNSMEPEIQRSIFFPEELKRLRDVETYLQSFPKNFNPSGTSGMSAFREFFHSPTGALVGNARDFGIEQFIRLAGQMPENMRPNPIDVGSEMADKFNAMSAARTMAIRTEKSISQNIRALVSGSGSAAAGEGSRFISHSYDQKVDRIKELAENPDAMAQHLANHVDGLNQTLPTVGQSVSNSIATTVNYLNSKIPRPVNQLPLSAKWEPSAAQKQKFDRYYSAATEPVGVLRQIKEASLTSEAMEALATTHPDLLKEMREQLQRQITPEKAENLSLSQRQALSQFMGMPLDSSTMPSVIAANQAYLLKSAMENPASQSTAAGRSRSIQGGLQKMKIANRMASRSSQLEQGGEET